MLQSIFILYVDIPYHLTSVSTQLSVSFSFVRSLLLSITQYRLLLLLLTGDFNARIGRDNEKRPLGMGKQGIRKCNSNEFELIVTNTMFKQKDERKTTYMHLRSRHWHMIDFIITRCRHRMDIHSTRAMRGANC